LSYATALVNLLTYLVHSTRLCLGGTGPAWSCSGKEAG